MAGACGLSILTHVNFRRSETLWWIFALDEYYRTVNKSSYEQFRDSNEYGCVISGLRLARNRVGHRLALMLKDPGGRPVFETPDPTEGVIIDQLSWRPLDELPKVNKIYERPGQQDSYRRYLEGNAARYALRCANYFFIRRSNELDSLVL